MRLLFVILFICFPFLHKCCNEFDLETQPLLSALFCDDSKTFGIDCVVTCLSELKQVIVNLALNHGLENYRDTVCSKYEQTKTCMKAHRICLKSKHIYEKLTLGLNWACSYTSRYPFDGSSMISKRADTAKYCNMCPVTNVTMKLPGKNETWIPTFEPFCESFICYMHCLHDYMQQNIPFRIAHLPVSAFEAFTNELQFTTPIQRSLIRGIVPNHCKTIFDEYLLESLLFDETFVYDMFFMIIISNHVSTEMPPGPLIEALMVMLVIFPLPIVLLIYFYWHNGMNFSQVYPLNFFRYPIVPEAFEMLDLANGRGVRALEGYRDYETNSEEDVAEDNL